MQSFNLGPIWQASDSLSPRAPGSARPTFFEVCTRTGEVFEIDLVNDADSRRNQAEGLKGLLERYQFLKWGPRFRWNSISRFRRNASGEPKKSACTE